MYINEREQTILARLAFYGPARSGKRDMLRSIYDHFAAQNGPDTHFNVKVFEPFETLVADLGEAEASAYAKTIQETFGAPYEEVSDAGTLLWLRTVLPAPSGQYKRAMDVFTVSGNAWYGALRDYSIRGADSVVFVADARPDRIDASVESWETLTETYAGPKVLLVNHATSPDEFVELLGFEGAAFAENGGFDDTLEAFHAASAVATRKFSSVN